MNGKIIFVCFVSLISQKVHGLKCICMSVPSMILDGGSYCDSTGHCETSGGACVYLAQMGSVVRRCASGPEASHSGCTNVTVNGVTATNCMCYDRDYCNDYASAVDNVGGTTIKNNNDGDPSSTVTISNGGDGSITTAISKSDNGNTTSKINSDGDDNSTSKISSAGYGATTPRNGSAVYANFIMLPLVGLAILCTNLLTYKL